MYSIELFRSDLYPSDADRLFLLFVHIDHDDAEQRVSFSDRIDGMLVLYAGSDRLFDVPSYDRGLGAAF